MLTAQSLRCVRSFATYSDVSEVFSEIFSPLTPLFTQLQRVLERLHCTGQEVTQDNEMRTRQEEMNGNISVYLGACINKNQYTMEHS